MSTELFLKGLVIGFSIAAPVGPIGILCIRRTLVDGWVQGLVSGLGAASADATYGFVAAFGLTVVSAFLVGQQIWLQFLGGAFLTFLGIKTLFSRPGDLNSEMGGTYRRSLPSAFLSTFVLTLTNPLTILSFAAIFAGLGLGNAAEGYSGGVVLVTGVFAGSAVWWTLLSTVFSQFRDRLGQRGMLWINRLSGGLILVFGLLAFFGGAGSIVKQP